MMRILLLSNQPERTTRLMMFKGTLERLGYDVIVPRFSTRSWLGVASEARRALQKEKPDVVHLFNVPDIIYHDIGKLKGSCFQEAHLRLPVALGSRAADDLRAAGKACRRILRARAGRSRRHDHSRQPAAG